LDGALIVLRRQRYSGVHACQDLALGLGVDAVDKFGQPLVQSGPEFDPIGG
jgi:hypothetical protein